MIDWNNNGIIDPVDIGISIAIGQDDEETDPDAIDAEHDNRGTE